MKPPIIANIMAPILWPDHDVGKYTVERTPTVADKETECELLVDAALTSHNARNCRLGDPEHFGHGSQTEAVVCFEPVKRFPVVVSVEL